MLLNLLLLYRSGLSNSVINIARLHFPPHFLEDGKKFGEHPLVTHFVKRSFELRPALPKYSEIWDVTIMLNYPTQV